MRIKLKRATGLRRLGALGPALLVWVLSVVTLSLAPRDAVAGPGDMTVPVTQDFAFGSLGWSNGYGALEIAWKPVKTADGVAICGAASHTNASVVKQNQRILWGGSITFNGKTVLRNLAYFGRAKTGAPVSTATAKCKRVTIPDGKGQFAIDFRRVKARF